MPDNSVPQSSSLHGWADTKGTFQRRETATGRISKRGDGYFRYLLVHGARALTAWVNRNGAVEENSWLQGLLERKHYNVAVVAMAAKRKDHVASMLTHNTEYQPRQPA
jgi:hypothetical protein